MQCEFRPEPRVVIRVDASGLKVVGARVVWPKEQDLAVTREEGTTSIVLLNPVLYTALYLKFV